MNEPLTDAGAPPIARPIARPIDGHIRLPTCAVSSATTAATDSLAGNFAGRSPADLLELCWSKLTARDLDAAAQALDAAKRADGADGAAVAMEATLRWLQGDWAALRRLAEQVIAANASPSADDFLALATACRHLNEAARAEEAAGRALALEPAHIEAMFIAAWAASERGDGDAMLGWYQTLARLEPGNVRWAIESVRLLQHLGRASDAAAAMDAALDRVPNSELLWNWSLGYGYRTIEQAISAGIPDDIVAGFRAHLAHAPADRDLARPLMADVFGSDVIVAPARHSDTLVLVFTGGSDSLSMPLPVFDRFMATRNVTAVYLKDFQRLMYLNGIASLGADLPATIAALQRLKSRLGATRLCTIGDSAGGFAAIRYGVALDAQCALSFGGDTQWAPGNGEFAVFANRLRARFALEEMDLRPLLAGTTACQRIRLVYADGEERDRTQAQRLWGIKRVAFCPVADQSSHNILGWLAMHDRLGDILDQALGTGAGNGV